MTYLFTDNQEIKNDIGNPIPVSGTVELGSAALSALETTTVLQGTETWNVGGTVEITNDVGNPIPISKNTSPNSADNPLSIEWVYGDGATIIPWELQVARNKIAGVSGLSIAGYNDAIGVDWAAIWEYNRAYTYLPTAQQLRVWSSSALDTDITVAIQGLDANYNQITETVHLTNGITGVMTTQSFFRVNGMNLTQTPMNVGNISIGNSGKTIECTTIIPDAGRSQMCVYTVPAGYTFYLTQSNIQTNQTGSQTAMYRSYTRQPNGVTNAIIIFPFTSIYNSKKVCPRPYPEKTDIQWQAKSSSGTSRVGGQIEGFLIQNAIS